MKNKLIRQIISGIVCIILGVLIAIYGPKAIDTYLGIIFCVLGASLLGFQAIVWYKKLEMSPVDVLYGAVLLTVGVFLFTDWLSVAGFINFIVVIVVGLGAGLLMYGIHLLTKKEKFSGFLDTLLGVVALVIAILYLTVEKFRDIFWIIFGVVFAAYGLLVIITSLIKPKEGKIKVRKEKKAKAKKEEEIVPEEPKGEEEPPQIDVVEVKEIEEKKEEKED